MRDICCEHMAFVTVWLLKCGVEESGILSRVRVCNLAVMVAVVFNLGESTHLLSKVAYS
ncbi:hypothetical protein B0T16DRAFT_406882 [Cercophora newfieldiana]|uniref:Uncharacterized protein n=1 Tax=Cercophora newfieldiana TaxID=92897 RepID=A0AA39YHQ1_9PEZI|nr:hypothetical protein B0T16DRAFT_406882 [Cercophora newfieldiana]